MFGIKLIAIGSLTAIISNCFNKRGNTFPLFISIGILFSIGFSQFNTTNWLHPGIKLSSNFKPGHLGFYLENNIDYISHDNATKIWNKKNGISANFKINEFIDILIDINSKKNQFKITEDLLKLNAYQATKNINHKISYKSAKDIIPGLIMIMNNNRISYGGFIDFNFSNDIKIVIENFSRYKFYDIDITYDKFEFELNNLSRKEDINKISLSYISNNILLSFNNQKSINSIIESIKIPTRISSPFNNNRLNTIKIAYIFKNNSRISFQNTYLKKDFSLHFIQNNDPVIKLNKIYFDSRIKSITYSFNLKKLHIEIGYRYKTIDLLMSARFKTRIISDKLEDYWGAPIITNFNRGTIYTNIFFINFMRKIKKHTINLSISGITENYDIIFQNTLYPLIPILPIGENFKENKYNYKSAANFSIKDQFYINNYLITFLYSQHIPIKIGKSVIKEQNIQDSSTPSQNNNTSTTSAEKSKKKSYGGGSLLLSISVPIK